MLFTCFVFQSVLLLLCSLKKGARQIDCSHKYYFYNRIFILSRGLVEFRGADLKNSFPALKSPNT